MKRLLALLLVLVMALSLVACGGNNAATEEEESTAEVQVKEEDIKSPVVDDEGSEIGGYKIGFAYSPPSDSLSRAYRAALEYCAELTNCEIVYFDMVTWSSDEQVTAWETLVAQGCDGIIMAGGSSPAVFEYLDEQGVYYTGFTRSRTEETAPIVDNSEYCCGWINEAGGFSFNMGYDITEELARLGCKNIAYLGGPEGNTNFDERVRGIEQAIADYDLNLVTSYRGTDQATAIADILSAYGDQLDGIAASSLGETIIAAINSAGYAGKIKLVQTDAAGDGVTGDYFAAGRLNGVIGGNNVPIVQMYIQLFNGISGADRLYNDGDKIVPMVPGFLINSAEGWEEAETYIQGDIPGFTPDEIYSLISWYSPDTTVEEKEALMEQYCSSEYWNHDSIVARVKAYLGEE